MRRGKAGGRLGGSKGHKTANLSSKALPLASRKDAGRYAPGDARAGEGDVARALAVVLPSQLFQLAATTKRERGFPYRWISAPMTGHVYGGCVCDQYHSSFNGHPFPFAASRAFTAQFIISSLWLVQSSPRTCSSTCWILIYSSRILSLSLPSLFLISITLPIISWKRLSHALPNF
jgi:hypothetical protein